MGQNEFLTNDPISCISCTLSSLLYYVVSARNYELYVLVCVGLKFGCYTVQMSQRTSRMDWKQISRSPNIQFDWDYMVEHIKQV